jgi:hypothetical protein
VQPKLPVLVHCNNELYTANEDFTGANMIVEDGRDPALLVSTLTVWTVEVSAYDFLLSLRLCSHKFI